MKIALIRAKYDPYGGAEKFVETAIDALAKESISLTILTRQWPKHVDSTSKVAHQLVNPPYFTTAGRDRSFAQAVCHLLAREKFDLVQAHERIACCDVYRAGDGVHAEWLAQRARISSPLRRFFTTLNPHHRYVLKAERELFYSPRLKAVICNSQMVKQDIIRHFAVDESKLHVIYSGVDNQKFMPDLRKELRVPCRQQLGIRPDAPIALFVGSGFERKGLDVFLRAVATLPEWHAVVVGKDKHLPRYRALAKTLGLAGRSTFTGGVNDARPYYAASDVFALPTLYDPFPNACLEAMACGLPVITSQTSGAAELIVKGENGFVVDARDVSALSEALSRALAQPVMGWAAREKVLPYTPQAMAARYVALYRQLLCC